MSGFAEKLKNEWPVIKAAPFSFATAVGLVGVLIVSVVWLFFSLVYSTTISGKDATIQFQEKQLSDFREKSKSATPDEIGRKLADLEARITSLTPPPRRLTNTQKQKLIGYLAPLAKDIQQLMVFTEGGGEAFRYATDFTLIFKDVSLKAMGPLPSNATSNEQRGIVVGLKNPLKPSELAQRFIAALQSSELKVTTTEWPEESSNGQPMDFNLFICRP